MIPYIKGISYDKYLCQSEEEIVTHLIKLFALLKIMHENNCVLIDIKEDNIIYNKATGQFFFIDGGLFRNVHQDVQDIFSCDSDDRLTKVRAKYKHNAPECFYVDIPPRASPAMDIYSLGFMFWDNYKNMITNPELHDILKKCTSENPDDRPDIDTIIRNLNDMIAFYPHGLHI